MPPCPQSSLKSSMAGRRRNPRVWIAAYSDAHDKPDPAHDLGRLRQAPPDPKAEHERQRGHHEVGQPLAAVVRRRVEPVHADGRGVHAHEGQEGPEIDQFGGPFVVQHERPGQAPPRRSARYSAPANCGGRDGRRRPAAARCRAPCRRADVPRRLGWSGRCQSRSRP